MANIHRSLVTLKLSISVVCLVGLAATTLFADGIFKDDTLHGWVRITSTQTWKHGTLLTKSENLKTPLFDFDEEFYHSQQDCELALIEQICPQDLASTVNECSVVNVGDQRVLRVDPTSVPFGEIGVTRNSYCQEVVLRSPIFASSQIELTMLSGD